MSQDTGCGLAVIFFVLAGFFAGISLVLGASFIQALGVFLTIFFGGIITIVVVAVIIALRYV